MGEVTCASCGKPIKSENDLITAFFFFFIRAYHSSCYSKNLKSLSTIFLANKPINGIVGNIMTFVTVIVGLVLIIVGFATSGENTLPFVIFGIILTVFALFIRLYSYYNFEKPLK